MSQDQFRKVRKFWKLDFEGLPLCLRVSFFSFLATSVMTDLILGVGPGLFAVAFAFLVAVLVIIVAAYASPNTSVYIGIVAMLLPLLVFGCIMSAPRASQANDDIVIDRWAPLRISLIIGLALILILEKIFSILNAVALAPKYKRPDTNSRRRTLQKAHPSWHM